jgi:hypothetical protein
MKEAEVSCARQTMHPLEGKGGKVVDSQRYMLDLEDE